MWVAFSNANTTHIFKQNTNVLMMVDLRLVVLLGLHCPSNFIYSPIFAYMRQTFCPCEKLLSHMTMLVLGTIHLNVGEKTPSWVSSCMIGKVLPRGRNFNQGLGQASSCVEILTLRVRFPYPACTLIMNFHTLPLVVIDRPYSVKLALSGLLLHYLTY